MDWLIYALRDTESDPLKHTESLLDRCPSSCSRSISSDIPSLPGRQFNRIYGTLFVLLIFFGQLDGFPKLGFSSSRTL